jgi:outer membrane beta-barrel protein
MIRNKSLALAMLSSILLAVVPTSASAQAPAATPDAPLNTEAVDEALDLYWGKQREITPLERRNHSHASRHEFTLFSGIIPNERFFSFYPVGLRYDLFFHNDFALEVSGAYMIPSPSALNTFFDDNSRQLGDVLGEVNSGALVFLSGLSFVWSPIHGKFAAFTAKLTHFDVYVAAGVTVLGANEIEDGQESLTVTAGGHIGFGFRVQFVEWMAAKFEYRQHFYDATGDATNTPAEFNFGISFWTPGGDQ